MMSLLDRYIARQVIITSLMMLFLLTSLRCLFSLIDELGDLGKGGYQLSDALLFVSLMIPARLLEFFPMSVLIGALFGLGTMAANSELTVMRAAGMTTWRIAGSTIKASIILMVFVIIIGEWISPIATKSAQQLRTVAISGGELSLSKTGLWAKQNNEIIQIGNVLSDGKLNDITIYQLTQSASTYTNNQLKRLVQAKSATQQGENWLLSDVDETVFEENQIITRSISTMIWRAPLKNEQLETLVLEPETLNLLGLLSYIQYLAGNNMQTELYELAAWRKVMQPIAVGVMMFLAASFIFGPMRSVSMGARILSGVMLGFSFHLANQSFGPASLVFNLWPFWGAAIPLILFASLGYWLMKRNH
ncbi:LPS export ABC transporter permease LptG [Aliikangiella sp. IMCC44359]|uniref:LPS export ABC transporter permease LptG n=1 Tax=Aliikangiella sp. IMCC44359 TaxID=3459125 RepID=UPI00403AD3EB